MNTDIDVNACLDPTSRLHCLCEESKWRPSTEEVRRCVRDGATVTDTRTKPHRRGSPILSRLATEGQRDAFIACLEESSKAIDFTVSDECDGSRTPLHAILDANTGSDAYNRALVRALVERIARHPEDVVDWESWDSMGLNFISLAAQNQLLSTVWPEVRDEVAYFADNTAGIPLEGELWEWDWQALGEAEQGNFNVEGALLLEETAATGRLWKQISQALSDSMDVQVSEERVVRWTPPSDTFLDAVRCCVSSGANLQTMVVGDSMLSWGIQAGSLALVRCLLESPRGTDFSVSSAVGDCVLHTVVTTQNGSDAYNRAVMSSVVDRLLQRRSTDTVKWDQQNGEGLCFLSVAANNQLLSAIWPEVRRAYVAGIGNPTIPVKLEGAIWSVDLEKALGQQAADPFLDVSNCEVISVDRPTAGLRKALGVGMPDTDLKAVELFVQQGADIMFKCVVRFSCPLLTHCIAMGETAVAQRLLQSPFPVDFTAENGYGETSLHKIPQPYVIDVNPGDWNRMRNNTRTLLHLVLDRLEAHPEDTVDWSKKDNKGREPIAVAASCGVLSTWVQVVYHDRPVNYYVDHTGPIIFDSGTLQPRDVEQLSFEDAKHFQFV